jgi:hypothetical protein
MKGFGLERPETEENVTPETEPPRAGEDMAREEECCRTEKTKVLFAAKREHWGWMT